MEVALGLLLAPMLLHLRLVGQQARPLHPPPSAAELLVVEGIQLVHLEQPLHLGPTRAHWAVAEGHLVAVAVRSAGLASVLSRQLPLPVRLEEAGLLVPVQQLVSVALNKRNNNLVPLEVSAQRLHRLVLKQLLPSVHQLVGGSRQRLAGADSGSNSNNRAGQETPDFLLPR